MRKFDREGPVHEAIVNYLKVSLPGAIVHFCKNEINKRGPAIARELAKAKSKGAVTGFPDLIVLTDAGVCFFEVKAEGGYATEAQKAVHDQLRALGYRVAVVRSIDDVRARLAEWGIWTREAGSWQSIGGVAG